MTTLNVLVEAAKLVECDQGAALVKRRRSTHKVLEKNRRAEIRDFYENLKVNVPKIAEWPKCSHISILIAAKNYITELNEIDNEHRREKNELLRTQMELKKRIRTLFYDDTLSIGQPQQLMSIEQLSHQLAAADDDISSIVQPPQLTLIEQLLTVADDDTPPIRQPKQLSSIDQLSHQLAVAEQTTGNKKETTSLQESDAISKQKKTTPCEKKKIAKKMVSVEIQANEWDIAAELPNVHPGGDGGGVHSNTASMRNECLPSPTESLETDNYFFDCSISPNVIKMVPGECLKPLACLSSAAGNGGYSYINNIVPNNNCNTKHGDLQGVRKRRRKQLLK